MTGTARGEKKGKQNRDGERSSRDRGIEAERGNGSRTEKEK